tara:strand:- start:682 stop:963 length:282 start_codon:yes stop_codon:yes gene_type:complete
MIKIITISRDSLECFKQSWPCNGIPAEVYGIVVAFDDNGDLVDCEAYDSTDTPIDLAENNNVDGLALATLFDDAKNHHSTITNPELVDPIRIY